MTIKTLFRAIFTVAGVMAVAALIITTQVGNLTKDSLELAEYRHNAYQLGQEVTVDSDGLTRLARTYVVTLDPRFKKSYFATVDKIEGKAPRPDGTFIAFSDLLKQGDFTDDELALLDRSASLSIDLIATEEAAFSLVASFEGQNPAQLSETQKSDWMKAIDLLHNSAYHDQREKIFSPIKEFENTLEQRTQSAFNVAADSLASSSLASIIVTLLLLLIIACAYFVITRSIIQPLSYVVRQAKLLANGDLSVSFVQADRQDEIGVLLTSLQSIVDAFGKAIFIIRENSEKALSTSSALTGNAAKSRAFSIEQKDQSARSATAVEEMSYSAKEVSTTCTEAMSFVKGAGVNLNQTEESLTDTLSSIDQVSTEVDNSLQKLEELTLSVKNVAAIIDVINSIAEQTNLLALNAAIEAARAGEQGRGFAVVADEVRSLAQRTQASTGEVLETVDTLRQRSTQVKHSMEQSNNVLGTLINNSQSVKENVNEVISAMAAIKNITGRIETAASEQSFVSADIGKQVVMISDKAADIDELSIDVDNKATEIQVVAHDLQQAIQFFRV